MRRSLLILAMSSVVGGCSVSAGDAPAPPPPEPVGTASEALLGPAEINDCSSGVKSFIQTSINVGKFIAQTDELKSCVKANYKSCDDDDDKSVADLVNITSSANPLKLACTDLGFVVGTGGTMAQTSWWCQHDYGFDGNETFDIDQTYAQQQVGNWNASGNFFGAFSMAGTIWHEAMHVHGYQHGNSSASSASQQAIDNADSCGRSGDSSWFWRANSAPYDVGFCMVGAYTRGGAIGRSGTNLTVDDGNPGAAARTSIVDAYYRQAHKFLADAKRTDTFLRIGNGSLAAPAKLKLEAAGNSLPQQATSLPFGGTWVQDRLFDAQDQEYWTVTVPAKDRMRVNVSYSVGPKPTIEVVRYAYGYVSGVYTPSSTTGTTASGAWFEQDLEAGTYLVHIKAGSTASNQPISIQAVSAPAPAAPTSCSGFINCLGHVHVTCANVPETLELQRQGGILGLFSTVMTDEDRKRSSVNLEDDTPPASRAGYATYRVCSKSYGKTTCSPSFNVALAHKTCSEQFSCGSPGVSMFACFDVAGDERFCCNELPNIDTTIPTVQIPGPIPEVQVIATP